MDTVMQMISNVGFPIVAFLLMWIHSTKTIKQNTEVLRELVIELKRMR